MAAGDPRGELSTNDAGVWVNNSLVHITYDPKVAGRTTTAPHTRVPPLRSNGGHIKKLIGATLRARAPTGTEAIAEGDAYIIYDGMKHGNEVSLTTAPFKTLDDAAMQKSTRTCRILYNEESLRTRMSRMTTGPVSQMEYLHVVTGNLLRMPSKDRTKYEGTNQGEVIGFVKACKWDNDDEILRAPSSVVKEVFGKAGGAIAVGGANPDGGAKPEFPDGREPIFYHTHPYELDMEVSHSYLACAHIDLTPGQGHRALYCIIKKLPYFGLVLSEKHKEVIIKHLEAKVFKLMQEEGGPLYQPGLVALLEAEEHGASDDDDGGEGEGEEEEPDEEEAEEEAEEEEDDEPEEGAKKNPKKKPKTKPKSKGKSKGKSKAKAKAKSKAKATGARASIVDKLKKLSLPPMKKKGTKRKRRGKDADADSPAYSHDNE